MVFTVDSRDTVQPFYCANIHAHVSLRHKQMAQESKESFPEKVTVSERFQATSMVNNKAISGVDLPSCDRLHEIFFLLWQCDEMSIKLKI